MSDTALTLRDLELAELRKLVVETLTWAATNFRPGTEVHTEISSLATALQSPQVGFRPNVSGHETVNALREFKRAAERLLRSADRLPASCGMDAETLQDILVGTSHAQEVLRNDHVSFDQVLSALQGSWGDNDLSRDIYRVREGIRQVEEAWRAVEAKPEPEAAGTLRR